MIDKTQHPLPFTQKVYGRILDYYRILAEQMILGYEPKISQVVELMNAEKPEGSKDISVAAMQKSLSEFNIYIRKCILSPNRKSPARLRSQPEPDGLFDEILDEEKPLE